MFGRGERRQCRDTRIVWENRKVDKRGTEQDLWHRPWKNVENESWNLLVKFPVILASDFEKYDFDRDPLPFRVVKRNGRS